MSNVISFPQKPPKRIGCIITIVMHGQLHSHMLSLDGTDCHGTPIDCYEARECYQMWAPDALNIWFGDHRKGRRIQNA